MFNRLMEFWRRRRREREQQALEELKARYHAFRVFLENNGRALELIGALDGSLDVGDDDEIRSLVEELNSVCAELADGLNIVSGDRHFGLYSVHGRLFEAIGRYIAAMDQMPVSATDCIALDDVDPTSRRQVGNKAANLAQLRRMGLPVPNGFVITTQAARRFLDGVQLTGDIRRLLRSVASGQADPESATERIRQGILKVPMPEDLCRAFTAAWGELNPDKQPTAVSVRSSGVAEDRPDHSFAGQFLSVLNVREPDSLIRAYKEVLASAFSARAVAYRLNARLPLADFNMAVLCQSMVSARCAGVLLTCDPSFPDNDRMLVSAVPGLGTMAVDGAAPADLYRPSRNPGTDPLLDAQVAEKTVCEILDPKGGLRRIPVPELQRHQPLLSAAELNELVGIGRIVENMETSPQDIEWAITEEGSLRILQARPLRVSAVGQRKSSSIGGLPLASGACASPGKAVGRVCLIRTAEELKTKVSSSQEAQILLLPQGIVAAAQHLCVFEGVIVEVGNPADHLSCIAREYRIPMVTGALSASGAIKDGQWVVLDADRGQIFQASESVIAAAGSGRSKEVPKKTTCYIRVPSDSPRGRLRELTVPLNLTDAYGPTFSMMECRSVHDLIRLAHEMAVLAMFDAGDQVMADAGTLLRKIDIGVPFHFLVIDLGGALNMERQGTVLGGNDIRSTPLSALCEGLVTPGLSWHSPPPAGAVSGLFSNTLLDGGASRPVGSFNYALAARDYLNLNARVEYHFAMLDTICGSNPQANHIRFRFKGGGTGSERGGRRALFIREVMEAKGFFTTVVGDLVTASLVGAPKDLIREQLAMLGRLLGFSRLLDAVMDDDETPHRLARAFLEGRYQDRSAVDSTDASDRPV